MNPLLLHMFLILSSYTPYITNHVFAELCSDDVHGGIYVECMFMISDPYKKGMKEEGGMYR